MKMLSLFSGIGAFETALDNLGLDYELVGYCEIDKYASKSYSAIHNVPESMNLGDITKINEKELPKDIDLITYGFPCQDISLAGKQKGLFNEDGTQTRSGLFFEALRIIEETQPRVAIAENVKNLVGKKFKEQFEIVLDSLEKAGYVNRWTVLNAKDFGVPQNRERVFIVSIRKDIDDGLFEFPQGFPLELRLKDVLESEVDEKFYLDVDKSKIQKIGENYYYPESELKVNTVCNVNPSGRGQNGTVVDSEGLARTVTIEKGEGQKILVRDEPVRLGNIYGEQFGTGYAGNVWDKSPLCPTLMTMQGGNRQPLVTIEESHCVVRENNYRGHDIAVVGDTINFEQPGSKTRRGRVGHGVAQTLNTAPQQGVVVNE